MKGDGDAEHVPGAVGVIGFAIRVDFEIRWNTREWVCHADRQGPWFEEEGVAVVEFFVIVTCFFDGDVKVRGGFVHSWREGCVRDVVVDEVSDLPEEGVVSHW